MATATPSVPAQAPPEILSQLRDIRGLDPVSWWPPALGWWLLAGLILLLLYLAWRYRASLRLRIPPIPVLRIGNWRWDAGRQLRDLRQRAAAQDPKRTAVELSELLRRVAMARLGREACAGLVGEAWLAWLAEQDPKGFDWRTRGRPLLDAPYAPPAPVWVADPLPRQPRGGFGRLGGRGSPREAVAAPAMPAISASVAPPGVSATASTPVATAEPVHAAAGQSPAPALAAGAPPTLAGPSGRPAAGPQDWLVLIDAAYQWVLVEDKRRV